MALMALPLELLQIVFEFLQQDATLRELFRVRCVNRLFADLILQLVLSKSRLDEVFRGEKGSDLAFDSLPHELRQHYLFSKVKAHARTPSVFSHLFQPVLDLELGLRGIDDDDGAGREDAIWALLDGVAVDGTQCRLLFAPWTGRFPNVNRGKRNLISQQQVLEDHGMAVLFRAMKRRDYGGVRRALVRGAALSGYSACFGCDPLRVAVNSGDAKVADLLLTYGTFKDPGTRADRIVKAITHAACKRKWEIAQMLIDHPMGASYEGPALVRSSVEIVMRQLVESGDMALFESLAARYPGDAVQLYSDALFLAVELPKASAVAYLLDSPVIADINQCVNKRGLSPLYVGVTAGQRGEDRAQRNEIIRLLLKKGANPNESRTGKLSTLTPLVAAQQNPAAYRDTETMRILLEHGAADNLDGACGASLLFLAALTGDIELTRLVFERGAAEQALDRALRWASSTDLTKDALNIFATFGWTTKRALDPRQAWRQRDSIGWVRKEQGTHIVTPGGISAC